MEKHTHKATTVRFNDTDKANIERIKERYACTSDTAAIRLALQLVAHPSPPKKARRVFPSTP